jgi:hypothetical protein
MRAPPCFFRHDELSEWGKGVAPMGLASKSQEVLDARRIVAFKKSLGQVFFPLSTKICDVGPAIPRNRGQIGRWGFAEADRLSASIFAKRRLSLTRRRKKTVLAPPLLGSGSVMKFQIYQFLKQTLLRGLLGLLGLPPRPRTLVHPNNTNLHFFDSVPAKFCGCG